MVLYNPIAAVAPRRMTRVCHERRTLNTEQATALLATALEGPMRRLQAAYKGGEIPMDIARDCERQGRRDSLAYRLMLLAGLRKTEVRDLRRSQVDLDAQVVLMTGDKSDKLTGERNVKRVPLAEDTVEALRGWFDETNPGDDDRVLPIPVRFVETLYDDLLAIGLARRVPLDANGNPAPLGGNGKPVTMPARWR